MPKIDSFELEAAALKISSDRLNLLPKFASGKEAALELTGSPALDGTAWSNTKSYFQAYPAVTDGVGNTLNTLSDTLTNYLGAFQSEVGSPKHQLNTEELIDLKNKLERLQRRKQEMIDAFNKFPLAEMLGGGIVQQLNNLDIDSTQKEIDILEKYQTFEAAHGNDFDEVKSLLSSLKTGLMQMGGQKIVGNPANGYVPRNYTKQPWMQKLKDFNAKQPKDRIDFIAYPSDNHGGKEFVVYKNGMPDKELNMKLAQLIAADALGILKELFINDPHRFFVGIDPVTGNKVTFEEWLKAGFWTALDLLPLAEMLKIGKNIKLGKNVLDGVSLTEKELEIFSKMQGIGDYTVVEKVAGAKTPKNIEIKYPLSKKNQSHINKHNIDSLKKQSQYLTDQQLAEKLEGSSFFNSNWSKDDINKYVEIAYNDLLAQGKTGDTFLYTINGENIKIYITPDGKFGTAYGTHRYTLDEFRNLLK